MLFEGMLYPQALRSRAHRNCETSHIAALCLPVNELRTAEARKGALQIQRQPDDSTS